MGINSPTWNPNEKEIDKILKVNSKRELFIVGQIIIERILDKVLERKFLIPPKILDDPRFPMQMKMELVKESEVIRKDVRENIARINSIRNAYGHRINPSEKSVKNWLIQLHYLKTPPKVKPDSFGKYRICVKQTLNELRKMSKKKN